MTDRMLRCLCSSALPALLIVALGMGMPPAALAQDSGYSATLYAGSCGELEATGIATAPATPESGSDDTGWSYAFALPIEAPMAELLSAPHAIAVEATDGEVTTTVACGALTGEDDVQGNRLIVGLTTSDDGRLAGLAVVTGADDGAAAIEAFLIVAPDGAPAPPAEDATDDLDIDVIDDTPDDGGDDGPASDDGV